MQNFIEAEYYVAKKKKHLIVVHIIFNALL